METSSFSMVKGKVKKSDILMVNILAAKGTQDDKYSAACSTILGIPLLFKEDRCGILGDCSEPQPGVYIEYTSPEERF